MARAQAVEEVAKSVTKTITYIPGHGDPPFVQWGGHTFHANVAKEITGNAEGTKREQLNMELIERARDNKTFQVGGAKRPRAKSTTPETADQYRAHLAEWLKTIREDQGLAHVSFLIERFAKERDLRILCEVGASDYELISTLFMPVLGDLAKADELTEDQVAAIWRQHGFNELPW